MRAILFASATRTSIGGLRVSIPPSQVPGRAAAWTCRLMMTLLAPMISNRLSIGGIILLALYEGLDVSGRDQPHLMAKLPDLSAPVVRPAAGFHRDNTGWQLVEERQHLRTTNLLA